MVETAFKVFLLFGTLTSYTSQSAKCPYAKYAGPAIVHTACLPPNTSCSIVSFGVSKDEQKMIVNLHNEIRNTVASGQGTGAPNVLLPQASDMRQLTWKQELADIAQAHANQCTLTPDCYRCRATESYDTGENIYYQYENYVPPNSNWTGAIAFWEQSSRNLRSVKANTYQFSAFTQMIWAQTKEVGCAMTRFRGTEYRFIEYLVCVYGPAGNYADKDIYETGTPCTDCTYRNTCCGYSCNKGQMVDYQSLCKTTLPPSK